MEIEKRIIDKRGREFVVTAWVEAIHGDSFTPDDSKVEFLSFYEDAGNYEAVKKEAIRLYLMDKFLSCDDFEEIERDY